MEVFLKVIQVILALSILVLVHEFGHFFFARLFKIKVDKFYLFFDAGFALFRWKPKNSDTEYGIGWLPFGGYCKIAGMIDESMDEKQIKSEPQPWEFRSHPAWQRFFVLFGGVFFNFILAILVYSGILFNWGEEYIKNKDVTTGIAVNELATEIGFRNGDIVLAFDDNPVEDFNALRIDLIRNQARTATVLRDGDTVVVDIDEKYMPAILNSEDLFTYGIPFIVDSIPENSQNYASGLTKGDKILRMDSTETPIFAEVKEYASMHKGQTLIATVVREPDGTKDTLPAWYMDTLQIPVQVNEEGVMGIYLGGNLLDYYKVTKKEYSFFASIPAGFKKACNRIASYWKELKLIFTPKTQAYKSVGSFIAIGRIFPGTWNWAAFWEITAFLSIMLAVLNILPVPALDGGHLLFTLYEMVTGRKPSDKFLIIMQYIGMILIIGLMILAFGNDIMRLLK
ncbi:MAG: RIP metalloprotease RseP [Candidatus Egerieousia sp.]